MLVENISLTRGFLKLGVDCLCQDLRVCYVLLFVISADKLNHLSDIGLDLTLVCIRPYQTGVLQPQE